MNDSILKIGKIVEVSSSKAIGELEGTVDELYRTYKSRRYAVGQIGSIVRIEVGDRLVFGFVTALRMAETIENESFRPRNNRQIDSITDNTDEKFIHIDLFGEAIRRGSGEGNFVFQRGVVNYPLPGQDMFVASISDLEQIYRCPDKPSISIGMLSQATSIPVHLLTDELLGKHFAVLGTTGSGKSCSVTVLLRSILDVSSNAHIILFDPHNEYVSAFPEQSEAINLENFQLPYWYLNYEESLTLFSVRSERVAANQASFLKNAILNARKDFLQK